MASQLLETTSPPPQSWTLPDGECHEAAKTLADQGVPFIVHTSLDVEVGQEAFHMGLTLLKPTEATEVVRLLSVRIVEPQQKMTGWGGRGPS